MCMRRELVLKGEVQAEEDRRGLYGVEASMHDKELTFCCGRELLVTNRKMSSPMIRKCPGYDLFTALLPLHGYPTPYK